MILTFGVLLCTFAMLLFSLSRWEKKRRRVETLRFLSRLVRSVRTGVADYCTPLPRIFSSFSECGEEERAFLSELSANGVIFYVQTLLAARADSCAAILRFQLMKP